jgi:ribonuclease Z
MHLTITGFSTALFSTWYFVDELSLLLDCGDGACAGLLQKSRKARTIAISHADRDHLNGLGQFLQLNTGEGGLPTVLYPRDCGSFPALRDFLHAFDQPPEGNRWLAIEPGHKEELGRAKARIEAFNNRHIAAPAGQVKSLSYRVVVTNHRLRPEFAGRADAEIAEVRKAMGDEAVMISMEETLLAYSADTPIEPPAFWGQPKVLIHESTFLTAADAENRGQDLRHSALDQVLPMAAELPLEALILGHFSTRYSSDQIVAAVRRECGRIRPGFPVFTVLPGEISRDILGADPAWAP